eukprot:GFUD01064824.1.p1 GENE.GFUD01064824.1~~GFUD01064824.1.p1  ORF type:complete len:393 (+),score=81.19 GFUD01064824.1:76-1254(+)
MKIFLITILPVLVSSKIVFPGQEVRPTRQDQDCSTDQCCKTTIDGRLVEFCPGQDPKVFGVQNYTAPIIIQQRKASPTFKHVPVQFENSDVFTLRTLTMNVWGLKVWAEEKGKRIPEIVSFLKKSNQDIVFIQEAWYHADFQVLKDTFPYSTFYGTPGSILCPSISNDQSFYLQVLPFDCHGLMILSKHKILSTEYVFFKDRIPKAREFFGRRGAIAATMEVTKAVDGVTKTLKVSAINTHLATWYSSSEGTWTSIREKQADEVLALIAVQKEKSDLVVVAGDLNATPESAVLNKFIDTGLVDTLVDLEGAGADDSKYVTYGHADNTWTGPGGMDEHPDRIDYMMYTHGNIISVGTAAYGTVDAKAEIDNKLTSLSDHMWAQANLIITFCLV